MALPAHRAIDHTKGTTVSEGSRKDAKPPVAKFGSYEEEWTDLVQRRIEVQRKLQELNRRASRDNMAIRSKHPNNSNAGIREWNNVKGTIEQEQEKCRVELRAIEDRQAVIKPKRTAERDRLHEIRNKPEKDSLYVKLDAVMIELATIKKMLVALTQKDA